MSKKKKITLVVVIVALVIGAALWFVFAGSQGTKVSVGKVSSQSLAVDVMGSGKVTAGTKAEVYPDTQGIVGKLYVKDGDTVVKGQKLARLKANQLESQYAQAKAGLAQAEGALDQANFAADTKSSSVRAAKSALNAANVAYDNAVSARSAAKTAVAQAQKVVDSLGSSAPQYQTAKSSLATAKANYLSAKTAVAQASSGVAAAKSSVTQASKNPTAAGQKTARANVTSAQKAVDVAKSALDKATITAPIDGTVVFGSTASMSAASAAAAAASAAGAGTLAKGSAVAPGSVMFTILDPNAMSFTAEIDEADIEKVDIDQVTKVTLDAFADKTFTGRVASIGTQAQSTSTGGSIFEVEIALDANADAVFKLGMKGDATVQVKKVADALAVPIEALFSEGGKDYVYVVGADDMLKKTTVTAGSTTDTSVQILKGASEGTRVALAGSVPLKDGMKITIAPNER